MNTDLEYLYLDVAVSDNKADILMKLGVFMYVPSLGLKGGQLKGAEAANFLKQTNHGMQPDLINYSWLFAPEVSATTFPLNSVTVEIPSVHDVKFKHNKFDRKRRRVIKSALMSIPSVAVKKTKSNTTPPDTEGTS